MTPTTHFRLSPSSASRWLACPGSARADLPHVDSPAAATGRDVHEIASFRLDTGLPIFGSSWQSKYARKYVAFVDSLPGEKHFEQKIASEIVPEFGGTIDALVVTDAAIQVVDLKTGKWKVPAKGNAQLLSYLALARERFPGRESYAATIIQPAVYVKPNTATFTTADVDAHIARVILASTQTDVYAAGFHCRFCPLRPTCGLGQAEAERCGWPS